MSYKNILAPLAPNDERQASADFIVSMAQTLGAHVTACSYVLEPHYRGLPWLPQDLVASHVAGVVGAAERTLAGFKEAAKRAEVDSSTEILRASLDTATSALSKYTRVHDVAVFTQSSRGIDHFGDLFMEAALFYSGRPIILVPAEYHQPFSMSRVVVAWDGSQRAASAVAHAMPILTSANRTEVVVVGDKEKVKSSRAGELISNLERHEMDVHLICRDEDDHAEEIAREVTTWGASLLVMGGYGRSVAREMFFGGVTRHMMTKAPVPVLMAH